MFGTVIEYARVTIKRRKWFPFQRRNITMAPRGHLHFHPLAEGYCDDFSTSSLVRQAHFIHEMTHVWQTQTRGDWYLVLRRHPWCRYDYNFVPGWTFAQYGIEQQAEIVSHAFLLQNGVSVSGAPPLATYEELIPFLPVR